MALSKTLTEYFIQEFKRSPEYRQEHLAGCARAVLNGELEVARELIKHAIHGSMGFESLGKKLGKSPKSLHRSFGPKGNPTAKTLIAVLTALQDFLDVSLEVKAVPRDGSAA